MFILSEKELMYCASERRDEPALAMAYVPIQRLNTLYSPETAISRGTLFPELDKPFCGRTIKGGGNRA